MTKETLKKKLSTSGVRILNEVLEVLETKEVLALIRLSEKRGVFITVSQADPVPFEG